MQLSISSRADDIYDLVPASKTEFATEVGPVLTLLAPSGMAQDERKTWLAAAYKALDGIPIRLLQRGVAASLRKADHPSKVVRIIFDEIKADWDWRKRAIRPQRDAATGSVPFVPREEISEAERDEVRQLMAGLSRKLSAKLD